MRAVIEVDVPEYQIGKDVSIYFPDTMVVHGTTIAVNPESGLISKKMAIESIEELNVVSFYEAQEDSRDAYYEIKDAIKKLPSVKPKIGHWEMLPPIFEEICMCSNCGMKFKQALQFTEECPNCNAIMILKGDRRNG